MTQQQEKALAEKYGAASKADHMRGAGWKSFALKGRNIWQASRVGVGVFWVSSRLKDGYWQERMEHEQLQDAFDYAMNYPVLT